MAEYIEKQAAIKAVHAEFDECLVWDESGQYTANEVENVLEAIPPADVRPVVRGQWIEDESGIVICSNCGEEHEWDNYRANFCDTCGADMRGGDADGEEKD